VYGRSPLTPEVRDSLPTLLLQGVIIAADRHGSRMLLAAFQPRRPAPQAAAELAPDVTLEPVGDYLMVSCSVAPGTVIPPAGEWTGGTPCPDYHRSGHDPGSLLPGHRAQSRQHLSDCGSSRYPPR
jgi:hypothetical protein